MTTRGPRPGGRRGRPRYYGRRKVCSFCVDHVEHIDYKNVDRIRRLLSDRFMVEARRKTGVCSKHQRALARAIKRARHLAMLPFSPDHSIMEPARSR
jgi:small subunit ribosomal protein S18